MKYIFQYFNIFFGSKNYNFIDIENDPFRRKSFKRLMVQCDGDIMIKLTSSQVRVVC